MGEHEQILGDAVRNAGEQRQRLALFRAEVNSRQTNVPQRQNFLYMPPYAASPMKRGLTRIRDLEALDLDRLATRPHSTTVASPASTSPASMSRVNPSASISTLVRPRGEAARITSALR